MARLRKNCASLEVHPTASGPFLVTSNVKEFQRVPSLVVEDWR
jgi:hypothetical protein